MPADDDMVENHWIVKDVLLSTVVCYFEWLKKDPLHRERQWHDQNTTPPVALPVQVQIKCGKPSAANTGYFASKLTNMK